ncbi:peptidoglycan editing factor PgeF [Pseudoxanthomonas koreensis]|uniref:peptidoglycan editing factor PgeF n=1 Tax=Pseudoxanthomonas koreensis TaxID=266061 RepID=UPI0013907ABC|nr:peptidoglycan editing factor PgeF [Pseudoxanthomonas koreensis]KAF1692000.1 multi-copper polyphenol oxidoreductase [Pseudoxanthomonas koreensis]
MVTVGPSSESAAGIGGTGPLADPAFLPAAWPAPPGVVAFTTLRHGAGVSAAPFDTFNLGARCGDDPSVVAANRAELARRAGLPSSPYWLRQVHGSGVLRFDARAGDEVAAAEEPEADAAVTSKPGTVLAILTADCLPVVFAARDGSEVGAAHAGWRGLAGGVLEATVAAMATPAAQLLAWLGPAAGPLAYEIGAEVRDAFIGEDPEAASAFTATRPGHWRVDLYALARRRLQGAGMPADAIHGGGLCTISDPRRFYSHRRDQRTGRMATVAWLAARG